ncbi:MAG: helix-turn-helix transcriptional regulator [Erysipelotrichales bacterium]|nr:helix-turn-helix transcriptional regulator [Erysipelotrichales bacterium]
MNYPNMIKKLRIKMLLTQQEFADRLGVSFETINRWENNKNEPTMKYKRELSSLFKKYKITEEKED